MTFRDKTILVFLLLLGISIHMLYIWASSPGEFFRFVWDDSLINFAVARHIAEGYGFRADGIHYTNSAHFVAVFAGVPCQMLCPNDKISAMRCTLTISALFSVASGLLLFLLVKHFVGVFSGLITLLLFVTSCLWFRVTMTGMDPAYTMFFVVLQIYCYFVITGRGKNNRKIAYFLLGLSCGAGFVSRFDQAIFAMLIATDLIWRRHKSSRELFYKVVLLCIGFWTIAAFVITANLHYTGNFLPSSARSYNELDEVGIELVVLSTGHKDLYQLLQERPSLILYGYRMLMAAQALFLLIYLSTPGALGLMLVLLFKRSRHLFLYELRKMRELSLVLIAASVFLAVYVFYFVNWYLFRYLTPVYLVVVVAEGIAIGSIRGIFQNSKQRQYAFAASMVCVLVVGIVSIHKERVNVDWSPAVIRWMGQEAHDKEVVASASLVGSLAYFTDATVIDLGGKLDGEVIKFYANKGMDRFLDEVGVDYFVDKECYLRCILRHCCAEGYLDKYFERVFVGWGAWNPSCNIAVFRRKE